MTIVAAFLFCMCFCLVVSCEGCSLDERETFLKFKGDLEDPSSFLSSWVGQKDCCTWFGVVCDKFTDHVTELHLGWPSSWHDSMFSGKLNPSLLQLKNCCIVANCQNSLHGVVYPDIHFANLKKLACFYASGNHMVLKVKPDWDPSKLLQVLDLESWPPLNADCSNDSSRVLGLMDGEGNDEEHELHWFSGSIALDFVGGFCSVVALFAFNRP
ncbi:unnamed protein product [Linum tenue]|uniref:Leucine-rich repeat-containing N-terminal plant-type domain-containing protein n=1 Tax=Linum tenue TaxID=586396 RepID=A0AAV0LG63_9ROSI|nr:unnamed protein product [Linum tenue]